MILVNFRCFFVSLCGTFIVLSESLLISALKAMITPQDGLTNFVVTGSYHMRDRFLK